MLSKTSFKETGSGSQRRICQFYMKTKILLKIEDTIFIKQKFSNLTPNKKLGEEPEFDNFHIRSLPAGMYSPLI